MDRIPEFIGNDGKKWPATFDGSAWAKAFIHRFNKDPRIATDEGTMIGWFANAIMRGYDEKASQIRLP